MNNRKPNTVNEPGRWKATGTGTNRHARRAAEAEIRHSGPRPVDRNALVRQRTVADDPDLGAVVGEAPATEMPAHPRGPIRA